MPRPMPVIKKRADFLRARSGPKTGSAAFLLQKRPRGDDDPVVRFGYTVTKKLGGAVVRNRIKRRLRAAVAETAPGRVEPGCDYVVVARHAAATLPFARLLDQFETALVRLARPRAEPRPEDA